MTRARNWFDVGHYRRKFTAFVFYRSLSPSLPPPPPPPPPRPSVYHLLGSTQPVAPVKVLLFPGRRPFPRPFEFRFSREWPFFHSKSPDHSSILRLCLPVYGVVANLGGRHDSANGIINSIQHAVYVMSRISFERAVFESLVKILPSNDGNLCSRFVERPRTSRSNES